MKHVVTLTTSNPAHEHVSLRRRQSTTNFMVEAADEDQAIFRATAHFRKLGHYVHEAKVFKKKDELSENALALVTRIAPKLISKIPSVISTAGKELAVVKPATSSTARQVATQTRTQTTSLGSVIKPTPKTLPSLPPIPVKTAPVPVKTLPVPAPNKAVPNVLPNKPIPTTAPNKTFPVPAPDKPIRLPSQVGVKPMNPLAAAATLATAIPAIKNAITSKIQPQTQTQTQTPPNLPPPPTGTDFADPAPIPGVIPPFRIKLGNRGEEDIGTLGQYRGLAQMYQHHQFNEAMAGKPMHAIGRVLSKRKEVQKDQAESEKNKINMEPSLKPK